MEVFEGVIVGDFLEIFWVHDYFALDEDCIWHHIFETTYYVLDRIWKLFHDGIVLHVCHLLIDIYCQSVFLGNHCIIGNQEKCEKRRPRRRERRRR